MPPVINTFDPGTAASEAIGAYSETKRRNALDTAARAYQQQRDSRKDMESDREFGIEKGAADDAHARTSSQIATDEQNRKIAAATEEYNEKLRPLDLKRQELANQLASGQITQQHAQLALTNIQRASATIDLELSRKYGSKEAAAALQTHRAQASVATTDAQYAPQQAQAGLDATRAGIAATNASTAYTRKETALAGTSGGRSGGRASASERAQGEFNSAIDGLSENGRKFYEMLYSTNNPPTRVQAILALRATLSGGKSGLTQMDGKALEALISSRESQFVSPSEQAAAQRSDDRNTRTDTRNAVRDRETSFRDVARGTAYGKLPPRFRDVVRHLLVDQGMDVGTAVQEIERSSLDDASKTALTRALNGG